MTTEHERLERLVAGEGRPEAALMEDANPDRRRFIGGSDMAAVMGYGATYDGTQDTPYKVYIRKTGEAREEMDPAKKRFLERRKRWEPVIVQMLREEFDAEIVAVNRRYVDPELDFLAAEIDFEWRDADGTIQNGEIKTVSPFSFGERQGWGEAGSGDIPIHYEAQVQHGLGVLGRRVCAVAAMVGLDSMIFYRVARDDEVIHEMRKRAALFWRESVLAKKPPEAMTLGDLRGLYGKSTPGLSVEGTSEVGSKALRLRAVRGRIEAYELERDALEFDVKLAMREAEALTVDGRKVFTWKEQDFGMLDQPALKEGDKEIWRKYFRKGRRRVFKGASWS